MIEGETLASFDTAQIAAKVFWQIDKIDYQLYSSAKMFDRYFPVREQTEKVMTWLDPMRESLRLTIIGDMFCNEKTRLAR